MANLYRLTLAALLLLLSCVASAFTPNPQWYANNAYVTSSQRFASPDAICAVIASGAQTAAGPPNVYVVASATDTTCTINRMYNGNLAGTANFSITKTAGVCPEYSTGTAPNCSCLSPMVEVGGYCKLPACGPGLHEEGGACVPDKCVGEQIRVNSFCVDPPPCPPGQVRVATKCKVPDKCPKPGTMAGEYRVTNTTPTSMCEAGCVVSISSFVRAFKDGKVVETIGMGYYSGAECNTPSNPNPDSNGGNGNGDGNGGTGDGGTGNGGTGNGGTGNGGTGTGGTGTGGTGSGGSGNNGDKPEKCPGGKCSGDGTGGDSDGGTNPDPGSGDCPPGTYKANGKCWPNDPRPPKAPDNDGKCPPGYIKVGAQCLELKPQPDSDKDKDKDKPGLFSGSCGAFTCDGDAIQCAIAKEQHRRNCQMFEDKTPESELYNASKTKTGNQTGDLPGNSTLTFGSDKYDTTNLLGGASCIGDITVEVMGQPVVLQVSRVCPFLEWLRMALLAVGAVLWVVIVFRS